MKSGYYWIRVNSESKPSIGRYNAEYEDWYVIGNEMSFEPEEITVAWAEPILPPEGMV